MTTERGPPAAHAPKRTANTRGENVKEIERIVEELERQRPGDVARVKGLLGRSDALDSAIGAIEDEENLSPEAQEEILEVLQVMLEETNKELGIPERGR
jgi:hypothetical protein